MRALVGLLVLLGGCVYRVDPPFDGGTDAPTGCFDNRDAFVRSFDVGPEDPSTWVCCPRIENADLGAPGQLEWVVDLGSSHSHCGMCINACTDGTVCRDGACEAP
jgi:hypothetical protein